MRQITSQLREAATRRRLMGAGNDAGGASADHSVDMSDTTGTATPRALPRAQAAHAARRAACLIELLSAQVALAMAQQPSPPVPHGAPSARASADFTAQVMARLATPPPEPDPREARAKRMRAHVRRLAGIYLALVLVSGVALLALATLAPSLLLGLVAGIISLALIAMTFAAFISRLTGGAISGFGVAYLAMLATLTAPLLVLARRTGRGPFPRSRRR
jgi:hypothetical protein